MPSLYTFVEYSPAWPKAFKVEARRLHKLLGDELAAVYHIGSTSVPGLAAKPVIDLLPVVHDIQRIDGYTAALQQAGYRPWGEYGLAGRRLFTRDRGAYRTHNLHMYQAGNPEIECHLAFCAFLQSHQAVRKEYEALKRVVFARHPSDIEAYNNAKDAWIKGIEPLAIEWYRQQATKS